MKVFKSFLFWFLLSFLILVVSDSVSSGFYLWDFKNVLVSSLFSFYSYLFRSWSVFLVIFLACLLVLRLPLSINRIALITAPFLALLLSAALFIVNSNSASLPILLELGAWQSDLGLLGIAAVFPILWVRERYGLEGFSFKRTLLPGLVVMFTFFILLFAGNYPIHSSALKSFNEYTLRLNRAEEDLYGAKQAMTYFRPVYPSLIDEGGPLVENVVKDGSPLDKRSRGPVIKSLYGCTRSDGGPLEVFQTPVSSLYNVDLLWLVEDLKRLGVIIVETRLIDINGSSILYVTQEGYFRKEIPIHYLIFDKGETRIVLRVAGECLSLQFPLSDLTNIIESMRTY